MVNVEARLKVKGKDFKVLVDVDKALNFKRSSEDSGSIDNVLAVDQIFYDIKKGLKVSDSDLQGAFGTVDIKEIAEKIVREGEILLPSEYKKEEVEEKKKQVINFLAKNAIDPATGNPHSETRIKGAIEQAGVKIENKSIEQQITKIVSKLKEILPIKLETKKLKVVVPAVHTGKVYGLLQEYKEKDEWLSNGDLSCIINLPAGLQLEFYDKLNTITHGSAVVEEVKE
jgi:ribosome maturation protein SDO1